MGGRRKFTLEEVKQVFASNGCEYLDDLYVNHKHKHNYMCICGKIDSIQFKHFKRGVRCGWCSKNKKLNIEIIRQRYKDFGFELIDTEYKDANYAYRILCKCGFERHCSLDKLKIGIGFDCNVCLGKTIWDIHSVKQHFIDNGCEFLDNFWLGTNHPHKYRCSCGNISNIRMGHFRKGHRCSACADNGFKNDKPSFLYLIARYNQYKIGIYNEGSKRLYEHYQNGWVLLEQVYFELGEDAYNKEQEILDMLDKNGIPRGSAAFREQFDGYTESWNAVDLFVDSFESLFSKLF